MFRFFLALALGFTVCSGVQAATGWGTSIPDGILYEIDLDTGAATSVGSLGTSGVTALSWDPTKGVLYGVDRNADTLITIDTSSAAVSTVGDLDIDTAAGGLAFDPNTGTLYYTNNADLSLYTIDSDTGAATLVGAHGIGGITQGLAFDANTNTLYASDSETASLYTLNTSTGASTLVGPLEIDISDHGLDFDNDKSILYLAQANVDPNSLYTVNTQTGSATEVGELGTSIQGLAIDGGGGVGMPQLINSGLNDAWADPATDGQGFLIVVFPDTGALSLAWFTFDVQRPPEDVTAMLGGPGQRWLTAIGDWQGNRATLAVEKVTGGVFDQSLPKVDRDGGYGTITIDFHDCSNATLTYDIPSLMLSGTIDIARIVPDNAVVCEALSGM